VSIVLGSAEIRGSRKPGKGRVAAKALLTEQIKAVYEGMWETLGKTGFSLRPIRFDRAIAKGPSET